MVVQCLPNMFMVRRKGLDLNGRTKASIDFHGSHVQASKRLIADVPLVGLWGSRTSTWHVRHAMS